MPKLFCILFLFLLSITYLEGQNVNFSYNIGTSVSAISPGRIPFWLRSNQFGSIPLDRGSLSFFGSFNKEYNKSKPRILDWGLATEERLNVGYKFQAILIEGYGKLKISIFEIKAGRSKEIVGLCDTVLSSGSWALSGNALGLPQVKVSIPQYYTLPFLGRLFAFQGSFSHGWFGEVPVSGFSNAPFLYTYLHHLSLYGKFGKEQWRLKLFGGLNHQTQWGSEKKIFGESFPLSVLKSYLYAVVGKSLYGSRMGNSVGSIDLGLEYNFNNIKIFAYRQNFYDAGALYYLANILDGLNGLSIENLNYSDRKVQWRKMLVEVLFSKDQAGEPWSKYTPSGDEDYYNHGLYKEGWSYKSLGLGNPFITPRASIRSGFPSSANQYFINNRVALIHFGFQGSVNEWFFTLKSSYSLNYGTYATSKEYSTGNNIFGEKKQFSAYLDVSKKLKNNMRLSLSGAFDKGQLYYDAYGIIAKLSKSF
jgi:hypothetical protein